MSNHPPPYPDERLRTLKDIAPHRRVHFPASSEARSIQPFVAQDADNHPLTLRSFTPTDETPVDPPPSQPIHSEAPSPSQPIHSEAPPPSQPTPRIVPPSLAAEHPNVAHPEHPNVAHPEPALSVGVLLEEVPSSSVRSAPPLPKHPCGYAPPPRAIKEFLDQYLTSSLHQTKRLACARSQRLWWGIPKYSVPCPERSAIACLTYFNMAVGQQADVLLSSAIADEVASTSPNTTQPSPYPSGNLP